MSDTTGEINKMWRLAVLVTVISLSRCEEVSLTIEPTEIAIQSEKGETVEFVCKNDNETDSRKAQWRFPNDTLVSDIMSHRFQDNNGTLVISNIIEEDSGDYICSLDNREANSTATLKAYKMPSYFTEGMIVMGINLVLVLIFIGCGIQQLIHSRRVRKNQSKNTL